MDHKPADNVLKGAGLIVFSVMMIAAMNAMAKLLSGHYHPVEITFYRNITILAGFCAYMQFAKRWDLLKTQNLLAQLYRAGVGTCGVVLAFWAISKLPLADATTLLYAAPLFVTILSYPLLGEKVGPFRGAAVIVGFCGILLVANPTGHGLSISGIALALSAAFFNALTQLQLRKLGRNQNPLTTVFYFMLFGSIITGVMMPFVYTAPPMIDDYGFLILLAAAGVLQQVLKTIGYSIAPTSVVTPLNYSGLIWAALIGFLFWNEVPTASALTGAGIIISANLFILWREQYLKRKGAAIGRAEPSS